MKKVVLSLLLLAWFTGLRAQSNSLNLDFSDPAQANRFTPIGGDGTDYVKTVENGQMKIVLNRKEWHFLQVWVSPFDFLSNPYFSLRLKVDQPTPFRIWIKQENSNNELVLLDETIPAGADFVNITRTFANASPIAGNIQEIGLDIGGYQVPPAVFAGTVFIDEFKLGAAAKPATEVFGTEYAEDFSGELFAGWNARPGYGLSRVDEALRVSVSRSVPVSDGELDRLPSLDFRGGVLDVRSNPRVNLRTKSGRPFTLSVIAIDGNRTRREFKSRVPATGDFQTVSLDLSSQPGLDLSQIERFAFDVNRDGFAFFADVFIDDLQIGGAAGNLAMMDGIAPKKYYKNSGTRDILLNSIRNAAAVELTSVPAFVENASVTGIANGQATLKLTFKANQTGTGEVGLRLKGASGFDDHDYSFSLEVEDNLPPTIAAIGNIEAGARTPITVPLSGISDGNTTVEQALSFTVTSTDPKVASGKVTHKGQEPYGTLQLTSQKHGEATVTITVKDAGDGNNTTQTSFKVRVFNQINNPPTIDPVADMEVYQDAGPSTLTLTGIGDGDKGNQKLAVTAQSSDLSVVKNVSVRYNSGETAVLHYEPVADATGISTITVRLEDRGGTGANNGNGITTLSFRMEVVKRPVTGYVATLTRAVEGYNGPAAYAFTEESSPEGPVLRVDATDKFYWDGFSLVFPEELDLSENPYVTMEVLAEGQNTLHWIWLYDNNDRRNELNNRTPRLLQWSTAGQWTKLVFDFSGENDWVNNGTREPINNRRIRRILFDMHNADFNWPPPPNYTGTFRIRNLRVGSEADIERITTVTLNPVAHQVAFTGQSDASVVLSGISNGKGSPTGVSFSVTSSNPAVIASPAVGPVDAQGRATLSYQAGSTGKSTLTVTASAAGSEPVTVRFDVEVKTASADEAATVTINLQQKFQTMYGFGTYSAGRAYADMYTETMGGSAMRVGLIENQIEPVNDNDDPYVLNRKALNYGAFDWNHLRNLKAKGVSSFILTSWSPPAWMKTNLSLDHLRAGYTMDTKGTTNRLDFHMYEEYAESMVAAVLMFKEEAGIDLLGIGLQNEPAFHEPYPSAILGPDEFVELIKVVGRRFKREGIKTRLFMPEHVSDRFFFPDNMAYLTKVIADPEANSYCDVFAIHGYESDGIRPGQPQFSEWESFRDTAAPKDIWMTETFVEYRSFADALTIAGALYGALNYGNVSLWTQWSFEGQMASQGRPTPMLYTLANYAKFVRPGDVRVHSTSGNEDVLVSSFLNEETGGVSIVLINKGNTAIPVKLEGQGLPASWQMFNTAENRNLEEVSSTSNGVYLLPARSVTTLAGASSLNMNRIADVRVEAGTYDYEIPVSGLLSSKGLAQGLRLSLRNSNEAVVPGIKASPVNPDGSAVLTFSADRALGTSTVTVLASDASGRQISRTFRIQVVAPGAENTGNYLRANPNPSRGVFTLESDEEVQSVQVVDMAGRVLFSTPVAKGTAIVRAAHLKPGVYVLTAHTRNGKRATRLIIE